jgi:ubiquinone/menaquinone biosynthesis C-methylase UbiE
MFAMPQQSVNYWPNSKTAKAFWSQHELPAYQELLRDTKIWLEPGPGQRWLDLGCGGGQLTRALWELSEGGVAEVVGADCAAANALAYDRLQKTLTPPPREGQVRFATTDFSHGLAGWPDARCDGVVSGLALTYAECYSEASGRWTQTAYDRILHEVYRVLKPGGVFVFSVNVPEPAWGRVAWQSLGGLFKNRKPLRYLKKAWRLWTYGGWLTREARRGRFHYLPWEQIEAKLQSVGFAQLEHRIVYAGTAYLVRCRKPVISH